jgi:hypothetical protein
VGVRHEPRTATVAINNSYRSRYVRKIVAEYPDLADAFETRTLRAA